MSVPAKVILFGEHAVVYPGNHAVLWPLHALTAKTKTYDLDKDQKYEIVHDDRLEAISFAELAGSLDRFQNMNSYIDACLWIGHQYVAKHNQPRSLKIQFASNIPIGGFGSSAAVAASIIKAVVSANDIELSDADWYELVMQADMQANGKPSGGDAALVTRQKPIIVEKQADGSISIEYVDVGDDLQKLIEQTDIVYTGRPAQTTAETVQHVAEHNQRDSIIEQIESSTQKIINLIAKNEATETSWKDALNENGKLLEQLGVVPEKFTALSRKLRSAGSATKLSGGGALSGDSCGVLLYVGPKTHELDEYESFNLAS